MATGGTCCDAMRAVRRALCVGWLAVGSLATASAQDGGPPTEGVITQVAVAAVSAADAEPFPAITRTVTFGLPFAESTVVEISDGVPRLAVSGAAAWQFRTLDRWPDGSVRWALLDVLTQVGEGAFTPTVTIVHGANGLASGATLQSAIATVADDAIHFDTGPLQFVVRTGPLEPAQGASAGTFSSQDSPAVESGPHSEGGALFQSAGRTGAFNLFDEVVVDGVELVLQGTSTGILARLPLGEPLIVGDTTFALEDNGPARALLRVDGALIDDHGDDYIDFSCRIGATRGSRDATVTFTLRNANIERPAHRALGSLELVVDTQSGPGSVARLAVPDGQVAFVLDADEQASAYQAYSTSLTLGVLGPGPAYKPHIPKLDAITLADEGYRVQVGDALVFDGDKHAWPRHGWADLTGPRGGATVTIRHMPFLWPAKLAVRGNGRIVAGLFPPENDNDYVFAWRQHESRTATFSFHSLTPPVDRADVARRADAAFTGRARDYLYYDTTGVFPYDLVSLPEHAAIYAFLGVTGGVILPNEGLTITRHLPASQTGANNNHDSIERRLADEFLRFGHGGQFLSALDLALYKSEWQIQRSDDFHHVDDPGASNDQVPHSVAFDSDLEHRYREGLVAAYYLTGDERIRAALHDEAEILPHVPLTAQERSMYQTLRALAVVADVVDDEALQAGLLDELRSRLEFFSEPTIDVHSAVTGWGWEAPPGVGARGFFANAAQNVSEKPPGENFQARGWISASLGPMAFFRTGHALPPGDPLREVTGLRSLDLARWTRDELFPFVAEPEERRLALSYAISLGQITVLQPSDFHTILLGQAEAWRRTGDPSYLVKGLEQLEAIVARGSIDVLDSRFEVQHFFRALLDLAADESTAP